ncbi:MAG: alpha-mannosidase [Phormidesmis sp.]
MAADRVTAISTVLQTHLNRLRHLNTQAIQSQWQQAMADVSLSDIFETSVTAQWPIAALNARQHIAWKKGRRILWLYQSVTVPTDLNGYPLSGLILRLGLTWWADDAQIYVDGTLVQSGDLFECFTRLCLSEGVTPAQQFRVAIRLVSPGHDEGALVRSQLIYELPTEAPTPEPSFVADELTVLATLEPDSQPTIECAIAQLNWDSLNQKKANRRSNDQDDAANLWNRLSNQPSSPAAATHPFQQSLSQLRRNLRPFSEALKQRQIQCVGHAHLDMAWLWPISDTWNAAERTFKSIIDLQKDFPELTYTHSSPALFDWLERNRPELFQQIQQKVAEGSWSIDAGLWIEPEFNVISGEAIARHILYGQRYCQEKFGAISKIAWLPDSFGFCWQLPQLLTQGGIETFATLKLSWNDTTEFPHSLFWWQSPDGSRILSLMLPPIGTDIDPLKMSHHAKKWQSSTGMNDSLWLPGLGDHGGGPTRDMLEKAQRWQKSPFFPTLNFTTPQKYISALPYAAQSLPIWKDELYLELHRGCYTTHADQKQNNRRSEDLLYQAEVFATVAQLIAERPYPKAALEKAWKALLFNQFHDILPGTSIPEVFTDANLGWQTVRQIGQQVLDESLEAIASTIHPSNSPHPQAKAIIIFNPLGWQHSAVVCFDLSAIDPDGKHLDWIIYNPKQQIIPHQKSSELLNKSAPRQVLFLASDIPAVGYQCYWIRSGDTPTSSPKALEYVLENQFLKTSISPITGQITSLIEKSTQKEAFRSPGNQLQLFCDQSGYWDAWNIAPDYENHPLPSPSLSSIEWIETGPVRQRIRTTCKINSSLICQDYILDTDTPFLRVENYILWKETKVLLKVNFPLATASDVATYEIPFGAITRKTNPRTKAEKAKWEVPALRWANLGNQDFGVSILTDCKHGFDAGPNYLRLTLLKSPIWPDPEADRGPHRFTYAIYPHPGTWQDANTVRQARALSIPPIIYQPEAATVSQKPTAQSNVHSSNAHSFLQIHSANVILCAFKPTEDNPDEFVLRCYEAHGKVTDLSVDNSLNLSGLSSELTDRVNLLEEPLQLKQPSHIEPWQVSTYRLKKQSSANT